MGVLGEGWEGVGVLEDVLDEGEGVCVSTYISCMCCRVHLLQRCSGPP